MCMCSECVAEQHLDRCDGPVDSLVRPTVVHVWCGHGEGALYIGGKKISDYYTIEQANIVEALGFDAEVRRLDDVWAKSHIPLPNNISDCKWD